MKAIHIDHLSEDHILKYEDVSVPSLQRGDILVATHAAGINPIDWKTCSGGGAAPFIESLPFIPGWEFAGTVTACGADVTGFQTHDRVCGFINFPQQAGCFAEQIAAPTREVAHIPDNISMYTAAALPLAGLTAWQALFDIAHVQPKQRVLVLGAAGGVGHLAIQLAARKNTTVIGTASLPKHDFLHSLGCAHTVDYQTESIINILESVDVIIDCVGGQTAIDALPVLKPQGIMVTIPSNTKEEVIAAGQKAGKVVHEMRVKPNAKQLTEMLNRMSKGDLTLEVSGHYAPECLDKAFAKIALGRTQGKLVLQFI